MTRISIDVVDTKSGYGPASGTSFVIEDMAEVSDGEEVYGDFQYHRIEEENEINEGRMAAGGSWFDEYQSVRKTKAAVHVDGAEWN